MFYQVFLSPEVKKYAVITNKHGIYELPHEFPDDLRLRILGNNEKTSKNYTLVPILLSKKTFIDTSKNC